MAYTLWTRHLRHNPKDPKWPDRDRFILSAGHGSMLLYALLHLTGYDLSLEDLRQFRQWNSKTPGHPENFMTPGVEMATGPLGQGFATAVGMAIAESHLAARLNSPGREAYDHHTYVLCSDGDLMEGVTQEAASLAGHLRLGKLIVLYDDNGITIDGSTEMTFTEDTAAKFNALEWHTQRIDGIDIEAVDRALTAAKNDPRPSLILCKTVIGYGSPNKAGSSKSHGAPLGAEEVKLTKEALGLPQEPFWVPEDVRAAMSVRDHSMGKYDAWRSRFGGELEKEVDLDWPSVLPTFDAPKSTRQASLETIQRLAEAMPTFMSGSADLAESVYTEIKEGGLFGPSNRAGRNLAYGIREHAMAAAVNGLNLHGGLRAFGGTFLIFSDYCRPSIRLAALMGAPSIFVFSHDSIGLGEDGPTHQPVEHLMALRAIPHLNVMRPADGNETAACWKIALETKDKPCLLVLSRQTLSVCTSPQVADHPAKLGAYVLAEASGSAHVAIVATGSEVGVALEARGILETEGIRCRVVNMPSWMLFADQDESYRKSVLPRGLPTVSVEAGATLGWQKYAQAHVGLDRFGASAPGPVCMEKFGFTPENVAETARRLLNDTAS